MKLSWHEKDSARQKNILIMSKAEAIKKISSIIMEAFVNEDYDAIVMYANVIEQQLQAMLKLVHEIREIIEKNRGEDSEK